MPVSLWSAVSRLLLGGAAAVVLSLSLLGCGGGGGVSAAPQAGPTSAELAAAVSCPEAATAVAGQPVSLACKVALADANPAISWTLKSAPPDVSFSAVEAAGVEFIAPKPGEYRFQVAISHGESSVLKAVALTVAPVSNVAPTLTCPAQANGRVGEEVTIACTSNDDGLPLGFTPAFRWSTVTGPAAPILNGADTLQVRWVPTTTGRYELRLVVDDGGLASAAQVVVQVEARANATPTINCPSALGGTVGAIVSLPCTVADDGLPAGSRLALNWAVLAGPSPVALTASDSAATQFIPTTAGTYRLRLSASDGQASANADVVVTVAPPPNAAPSIVCAPAVSATVGKAVTLTCQASDDGQPAGSSLQPTWTVVSAPATVNLTSANSLSASFVPPAAGTYRLRLTVSDGALANAAEVSVSAALPPNTAPVVACGGVPGGTVGTRVVLACTASDDGQPAGNALRYTWSTVSAPAAVAFTGGDTASASFVPTVAGTYRLRLSVSDGALAGTGEVSVVVSPPANVAPTLVCPAAANGVVGSSLTVTCSATDDGQPTGVALRPNWAVLAGAPAAVTLSGASTLSVGFMPAVAGTYRLQLTVSDSLLSSSATVAVTVAPPPNQAPTVSCPTAVAGRVGQVVTVSCTSADDGLPAGSSLSHNWSVVSAPTTLALSGQSTRQLSFTPTVAGEHRLRLTLSDGLLTRAADVTVNVVNVTTVRVLPLGDSITNGWWGQQSYRYPLWKLSLDGGASLDYVGTLSNVDGGNPVWPDHLGRAFDRDHEGHSGWTAGEVAASLTSWLAGYQPDVALVHLGTNDILSSGSDGLITAVSGLTSIVQRLRARNPDVRIYVAKIIPLDPQHPAWPLSAVGASVATLTATLNSQLDAWAASQTSMRSPVRIVDQFTGFNARTETFDGIHPNAAGELRMAQRWWEAIRADF